MPSPLSSVQSFSRLRQLGQCDLGGKKISPQRLHLGASNLCRRSPSQNAFVSSDTVYLIRSDSSRQGKYMSEVTGMHRSNGKITKQRPGPRLELGSWDVRLASAREATVPRDNPYLTPAWRQGWDSNPSVPDGTVAFPSPPRGHRIGPLCHPGTFLTGFSGSPPLGYHYPT
ncbi:MAG: hypothetical protein OD814_000789 [Candidatus Alkanophagales archaeon MCA70_species_1]|nr:hypothetical protein [Candidatus Alkanophaga volatiphilum]